MSDDGPDAPRPTDRPSTPMSDDAGSEARWGILADRAQQALTDHFQGRVLGPWFLHNTAPLTPGQALTFNYWWLAHAVEARIDGAERHGGLTASGGSARLRLAENTYRGIRLRNCGRLFNHYFDDMGWLALAAVRLHDLSREQRHLDDAIALWQYIGSHGGTDLPGGGIAWRDSQPDYRNAPTNGAYAILSARLGARTGERRFETAFTSTLDFFESTFATGSGDRAHLVADGLNRTGDGTLDDGWLFTYNQGLYIGALVEAFIASGESELLDRATRTATATIARLAPSGLFLGEPANLGERGGGDAGLFKGIFFRYLELLLEQLDASTDGYRMLAGFFTRNTDLLAANGIPLAADDWSEAPGAVTALSTQLSALIALEARARFERHRAAA